MSEQLSPNFPYQPVDTYATELIELGKLPTHRGVEPFFRHRAPFTQPGHLADPDYWPRILSSGTTDMVAGAVVRRPSGIGHELIWSIGVPVRALFTHRERRTTEVRMISTVGDEQQEDGTHLATRSIRLEYSTHMRGAVTDTAHLLGMLHTAGVDPSTPVRIYAVAPPSEPKSEPGYTLMRSGSLQELAEQGQS